jgi:hypothetical protein
MKPLLSCGTWAIRLPASPGQNNDKSGRWAPVYLRALERTRGTRAAAYSSRLPFNARRNQCGATDAGSKKGLSPLI